MQMQIGARYFLALGAVDELLERDIALGTGGIPNEELNLLDRCHRLRNTIVGGLERGNVRDEQPTGLHVTENELSPQGFDCAVVGKTCADRAALVVIVDRNRVGIGFLDTAVLRNLSN